MSAVVFSSLALFISLYQLKHTRDSYALSLKPNITFGSRWRYETRARQEQNGDNQIEYHLIYTIKIISNGPGVAIIKDCRTYLNDTILSENDPFDFYRRMQEIPQDWPLEISSVGTISFSPNDTLLPDKSYDYITIDILVNEEDIGSLYILETLREKLHSIKTVIDYTSLNNDSNTFTSINPR